MSQGQRLEHIDLFDGPSWDARDYWDDVPRTTSRWAVIVQVIVGLALNLMVPAAFAGVLFAFLWGVSHLLVISFQLP